MKKINVIEHSLWRKEWEEPLFWYVVEWVKINVKTIVSTLEVENEQLQELQTTTLDKVDAILMEILLDQELEKNPHKFMKVAGKPFWYKRK